MKREKKGSREEREKERIEREKRERKEAREQRYRESESKCVCKSYVDRSREKERQIER